MLITAFTVASASDNSHISHEEFFTVLGERIKLSEVPAEGPQDLLIVDETDE